jgi:hypothetical protein
MGRYRRIKRKKPFVRKGIGNPERRKKDEDEGGEEEEEEEKKKKKKSKTQ